ncbi:MAG: hypothetical protein WA866_23630, partial [Pseudolabrys sp.]
ARIVRRPALMHYIMIRVSHHDFGLGPQASTQARHWLMLDDLDLRSATACDREQLLIGQRCDGDVVIVLH